jgi:hypothetical protein
VILPSKHITTERALLSVAGWIFSRLNRPMSVSRLWDDLRDYWSERPLAYQWFVLSMDLLFLMGLVELRDDGLVWRKIR